MITNEAISNLLHIKEYKEVERKAIERISDQALDAQAWVFLGEALLRRGNGHAAAQVFKRAHMLDPEASWVEAINREILRADNGNQRVDIEVLLDKNKVTVAAALLVRNEIRCIERCLRSISEAVDEIIVIDCESTDGTREIAQSFPKVKLVTFPWIDDFAAARNAGLQHIQSDWVIWVDADEMLIPEDVMHIREIAGILDREVMPYILIGGVLEQLGEQTSVNYSKGRMFAMKHGLRFWGRVHEQIGSLEQGVFSEALRSKQVLIRFTHDGYTPEVLKSKNKLERNLRLLEMMRQEEPDNPASWFYSGRETFGTGEAEKALEFLFIANEKAKLEIRFARRIEILCLLMVIHLSRNEINDAEVYGHEAMELRPDFPDAIFLMAQIEMKKAYQLYHSAESRLRGVKDTFKKYRGVVSADRNILTWKADLALADIARLFGKPASAKQIYLQLLKHNSNLKEAQKRLDQIEEQKRLLNGEENRDTSGKLKS